MEPEAHYSSDILIYTNESGEIKLDARVTQGTIWLTQNQIAALFQTSPENVIQHIQNIYAEDELRSDQTLKEFAVERIEGRRTVRRRLKHYNLDMVISVGYRVSSKVATRFRIWATERLVEYVVKGFTMDDERLKEPLAFGDAYYQELLSRIRHIRASEMRTYQSIRDIYKLAIDYDASDERTRQFFALMQNKMLFSVTGLTAAEMVKSRANRQQANMGLMTWKGEIVRKKDVGVAKNYLSDTELDELDRIVVMFLDFADMRARRRIPMYMKDWEERLNAFLQFNEQEILNNPGSVSAAVAKSLAEAEYDAFDADRRRNEAIEANLRDVGDLVELVKQLDPEDGR